MPSVANPAVNERFNWLRFTWISSFSAPDSMVTIDFREAGPGKTEVTLNHEKVLFWGQSQHGRLIEEVPSLNNGSMLVYIASHRR